METAPPKPIRQDDDRVLWLAVRRGLLLIVRAIETKYELSEDKADKKAA